MQILKFCKQLYARHTLWNCLIICINMKWIQPELWELQSGHGMQDGRMDGWTEWNQYTPQQLRCSGGIIITVDIENCCPESLKWLKAFITVASYERHGIANSLNSLFSLTIKEKAPYQWPFVSGIFQSSVDYSHIKGQKCRNGLICLGSDNGMSPVPCQAISWTSAVLLLIGPLGTNFGEILIKLQQFSFKNMYFEMFSNFLSCSLNLHVLTPIF